jgi:hypothetical protein
MDGGFKNWKAQGSKREEKDLSVNTFELGVDGGLISRKPEGSLAKRLAEAVRSNQDGWIYILQFGTKGYAASNQARRSQIERPGLRGSGQRHLERRGIAGARLPRQRYAGDGRSWPSDLYPR